MLATKLIAGINDDPLLGWFVQVKHFNFANVGRASELVQESLLHDDQARRTRPLIQSWQHLPGASLHVKHFASASTFGPMPRSDHNYVPILPAHNPMCIPLMVHISQSFKTVCLPIEYHRLLQVDL